MQVTVRLFATLRENRGKEIVLELEEGSTIKAVIEKLNIPEEEVALMLINSIGVKIDQVLQDKDTISIFPPVGGG